MILVNKKETNYYVLWIGIDEIIYINEDNGYAIFDLEDAVNVTEKDNARNLLYYYLLDHPNLNMEVVVRINGLDTDYYKQDLEKIVSDNIDAIMLPKARISYLKELDELLTDLEQRKKLIKKNRKK